MTFACFISVTSLLALIVDRAVYQDVNFLAQSFVEIRSRLNAEREPGSGISSVYSVFGNLFQFSYFFSFICLVYYAEVLTRLRCAVYLFFIAFCLLGGSYILGGRTIIGLFVLTLLAILVARVVAGRSSVRDLFNVRVLVGLALLLVSFVGIVGYVFYARASVSGLDSATYLHNFALHLHGRAISYNASCEVVWCDMANYLQLSGIYVTHVLWVMAENIADSNSEPEGAPVFGGVLVILAKVIGPLSDQYEFAGLFNSLPGSLYYQYGGAGVALGALLIGSFFAFAVNWLRRRGTVSSLMIFYILFMVLLVAPVLSAFNIIAFVFVLFALSFVGIIYLAGVSMGKGRQL